MNRTAIIWAAFLFACMVSGCTKEPSHPDPVQPAGFRELVQAYQDGLTFYGLAIDANAAEFSFEGMTLSVAFSNGIDISDCRGSAPAVLAWDQTGQWLVGRQPVGIWRNTSVENIDASPVYMYYTADQFVACLHNGNKLIYKISPRPKPKPSNKSIPTIYLTTDGGAAITSKEDYVTGSIKIVNDDEFFPGIRSFEAPMKIRGRGNSTWGMPKKPYKIKLDSKACLFDMSTDKEWCLLANYCDKSLLRNLLAMELSRMLGFSWTPRMVPVEVNLNGKYIGVYNFSEHKKVSEERVDIDLDAGDILFELEENQDETVCWWTDHGAPVMFSEPAEPTAVQTEYAKQYFRDFETALWAKDFATVYNMIDVDSFINNFIIQELTKNVDGNLRKSTFITLPKGGKLEMYHVWDFDITLGNCDYYGDGLKPWEGWWIKDRGSSGKNHGWYYRLFMDPEFVKKVKARWNEMYPRFQTIPDWIDYNVQVLGDAPKRNFIAWKILDQYVWPNYKVTGSYEGEVEWLQEYYAKRLEWMNENINAL